VADADEASGKQVQQEAAQELIERQGHQLVFAVVSGIAPAKRDLVIDQGDESLVGDGDAMGVVAQITERILGASKGRFGVDVPVVSEQGSYPGGEGFGVSGRFQVAVEPQLSLLEVRLRADTNLPRKTRLSTLTGRKKE